MLFLHEIINNLIKENTHSRKKFSGKNVLYSANTINVSASLALQEKTQILNLFYETPAQSQNELWHNIRNGIKDLLLLFIVFKP